jgi:hypothetical protein
VFGCVCNHSFTNDVQPDIVQPASSLGQSHAT